MTPDEPGAGRIDAVAALDPRFLFAVVPPALVTAVLSRAPADMREVVAWTVVNVASFVATALWVLLFRAMLRPAERRMLGLTVLVVAGASVGFTKGLTTSTFAWAAGLIDDAFVTPERWRAVSTSLQGALIVPVVGLVRSALVRYRIEYDRLILERARRVLISGDSASGERGARVARFVTEARRRIDGAEDSTVAAVLEEVVDQRLRPLTRELWEASDTATDFSLVSLLRAALHSAAYPALPVATIFTITAFVARTEYAPLGANLLLVVLDVVVISGVFTLARRTRSQGRRWDVLHLVATVSVTTLVLVGREAVVLGQVAGASAPAPTAAAIVVLLWLLVLTVLASAVQVALRTRGAVRVELDGLLGSELDSAIAEVSRRLYDREVADQLHSTMQNRLVAAARRIDASGGRDAVVREEVSAIGRLLDDLAAGVAEPTASLRDQVAGLAGRWEGFVQLETDLDASLDALAQPVQDRLAQAVAEAVNNAVRHGRAARVRVALRQDLGGVPGLLRLVVEDDGLGPVQRPAGLGSRLFEALSGGDWSLQARREGGSRLEATILLDGDGSGPRGT